MKKYILAGIMAVLLISLLGCGKPEKEEMTYEVFVAEYYQTKVANRLLEKKVVGLEEETTRLQEKGKKDTAEYNNVITALQNENYALKVEVVAIKAIGANWQAEIEFALNKLAILQAEKQDWARLYKTDYDSLMGRYNKLNALYPPSHFEDKDELVEWRANSGNITELGCLGLQRLALADGYIVSVHPDFEYCVVIVGDYWYKITPSDQGLVEKIRKVE